MVSFLLLPLFLLFLSFILFRSSPTGQAARPLHTSSSQGLFQPTSFPFALLQFVKLLPLGHEGILGHLVLNVFLMAVNEELLDDICELAILMNRFHPVLLEVLDELGGRYVCSVIGLSSLLNGSGKMTLLFIQAKAIEGCPQILVILGQFYNRM